MTRNRIRNPRAEGGTSGPLGTTAVPEPPKGTKIDLQALWAPQVGDMRFIGGRRPCDSVIQVWCGEPVGWAALRGVTGLRYELAADRDGPTVKVELELMSLQVPMFDAFLPRERVALEVAGITPAMRAAAEAAWERVMARPAPRPRTTKRSRSAKGRRP